MTKQKVGLIGQKTIASLSSLQSQSQYIGVKVAPYQKEEFIYENCS